MSDHDGSNDTNHGTIDQLLYDEKGFYANHIVPNYMVRLIINQILIPFSYTWNISYYFLLTTRIIMSDADDNSDTSQNVIGQVYHATPVNSDEDSEMSLTVSTELSHEAGFLSGESDLEDQFGHDGEHKISASCTLVEADIPTVMHTDHNLPLTQHIPNESEFRCRSSSLTEIKVHVHSDDVMYPFHRGVLISSQNNKEAEVFVHGNFEGIDFDKDKESS